MKYLLLSVTFVFSQLAMGQYVEDDWEERDSWMPLELIYELSEIEAGTMVADIGCHEGYFTIHLANLVGDEGQVYAVDVRSDRLETLKEHLEKRELENVTVIRGDYDNPKLPENALDVVVIMDTYHEMDDYMDILHHVYEALKPEGRIVIIEKLKSWVKGDSRVDQVEAHSLGPKYVKQELKKAGFKIQHQINDIGLWEEDDDKVMWIVVAQKPNTE